MAMTDEAQAFWLVRPGQGALRTETLAALSDGEVEVRTLFSGISRGTEGLVFRGEIPESEYQRMRAPFQVGSFPAPVKYGYISVGRVEAVDAAEDAELLGQPVFCLYPHQDRYRVPASAVHPLPAGLPPERAILAAQMETAINGLWDAQPHLGDRIAVVGAGAVGCLCAWLASRIPGCEVELVDINPQRAETAAALGVAFRDPATARPDADLVIHASGTSNGLVGALALAGVEATVLELSWFGSQAVSLPLGQAFHQRRLTLRSSQVGSLPLQQRARWDHRRRLQLALSLLSDPVLDALITGEEAFSDLPRVMARLAKAPGATLMHRIRYGDPAMSVGNESA
ncbi:zinc-dependent alcohol dehydrogenase [Halochromatium roseum]|uniref:zinc-dependent alcohol dehydrogenase n=1 Tax=Halochromatium roseum TaxID=391920 RepID=UPI0019145D63|nr:zinc-binding alcohol dehydrogenase [Halochromatium roseum]MBK5941648.1 dehydrogenase [Halochromatium roseum]